MGVYIKGMETPNKKYGEVVVIYPNGEVCAQDGRKYEAVLVPPHGRLGDLDAVKEDLRRQCDQIFKIDAVNPNDFWITRDTAYNQRLWRTWCESFYEYLDSRPTIIPAEEG